MIRCALYKIVIFSLIMWSDVARPDKVSGADINAICQEVTDCVYCYITWHHMIQAGMHAVRENRYVVLPKDFEKGYKNNTKKDSQEHDFYKWPSNHLYIVLKY